MKAYGHACFVGSKYIVLVQQCAGTSEVKILRVHYTLGGNAIRGAETEDLSSEHKEEHQTQR